MSPIRRRGRVGADHPRCRDGRREPPFISPSEHVPAQAGRRRRQGAGVGFRRSRHSDSSDLIDDGNRTPGAQAAPMRQMTCHVLHSLPASQRTRGLIRRGSRSGYVWGALCNSATATPGPRGGQRWMVGRRVGGRSRAGISQSGLRSKISDRASVERNREKLSGEFVRQLKLNPDSAGHDESQGGAGIGSIKDGLSCPGHGASVIPDH